MLHTPPPPPPPPPPKRHVVLKAFTENKLFYFSKIISQPLRAYFWKYVPTKLVIFTLLIYFTSNLDSVKLSQ